MKLVLAIVIGVLVFAGYRAAASASFFQVRNVEVQGTSRLQPDEFKRWFVVQLRRPAFGKPISTASGNVLSGCRGCRTAVVSRVLPDGIRVRITERVPRAVVRTSAGRFRWVDEDAVLLGEMLPTDQIPAFFLRGLNDEDLGIGA